MFDRATIPGFQASWPAPPWVRTWSTERGFDVGGQGEWLTEQARANRLTLARHLNSDLLWLRQVHGCQVSEEQGDSEADALISRRAGLGCAVRTADCLPVLFCHQREPVVAAAHAGWKGLVAGVLEKTVSSMALDPQGVMAWLGPAIGSRAFEVGPDMRALCLAADSGAHVAFRAGVGDRWWADIYHLARLRLARLGIVQVYGGGFCTVTEALRFYSWRREGGQAGRMAHVIWME